jgi:hypothetical protein
MSPAAGSAKSRQRGQARPVGQDISGEVNLALRRIDQRDVDMLKVLCWRVMDRRICDAREFSRETAAPNGAAPNEFNLGWDTETTDRVLIADDFIYCPGDGVRQTGNGQSVLGFDLPNRKKSQIS